MAHMAAIFFFALTFHSMFAPPLEYRVTPGLTSASYIVMRAGMKRQGRGDSLTMAQPSKESLSKAGGGNGGMLTPREAWLRWQCLLKSHVELCVLIWLNSGRNYKMQECSF